MTAVFSFGGVLAMLLLAICTCTYVHMHFAPLIDRSKTGVTGIAWKFARIGERASPYVAVGCVIMGIAHVIA